MTKSRKRKSGSAGHPAKVFDEKQLKALMRMKPRSEDAAAFFNCSRKTLERFITDTYGVTFDEFREQNLVHTRYSLVQTALLRAEHSDTMLKFCLENLCGWSSGGSQTLVQVKAEASVNTESDQKMVQEFKQTLKSYLDERKEPA